MKKEYALMALSNMRNRKLRSFLTLLGVLIAIATIFVLISLSLGLEDAVEEQFRLLGTDKFFVQPRGQLAGPGTGGAVEFTEEDADIIKKVQGVKEISAWTAASAKLEHKKEIRFVTVVGIDLDTSDLFIETGAYEAEDGRVLEKGDTLDIMIGSQYKHNNVFRRPVQLGDTLIINEVDFKIKGILEPIGNPSDDRLIYMPFDEFRTLFDIPRRIDTIVVQVNDEDNLQAVADRTERKLLKARDLDEDNKDFTILTPEELLESFGTVLNIITSFLFGVAAISLLVGGIGIANTVFTSVLERRKEIGVMKAIGAQNRDILYIFLIESGLLGLIGGVIGVALGIGIGQSIEWYAVNSLGTTLLRAPIPLPLVIGCLTFSFAIGALSGIWPAWQGTQVKPVEALRYE